MPTRRLLPVIVALCALLFAACGGDDQKKETSEPTVATTVTTTAGTPMTTASSTASTTGEPMGTQFTIVAKNVAFVPTKLSIPVNEDVEITFDNQDSSVPHNLRFSTPTEYKTEVKSGPEKETLKMNVTKKGTYDYVCDIHPTTMKGQLTVA